MDPPEFLPKGELRGVGFAVGGITAELKLVEVVKEQRSEVFTTDGDPAADGILSRPIDLDLCSRPNLDQARRWLRACLKGEHHNCPPDHTALQQATSPSRLIRVQYDTNGNVDTMQLTVCSEEHRNLYATLSYCWGDKQTYVTTTANFQEMLQSISLVDLPQTIRDAIQIAGSIGLEYLWIDALCIIQDSDEDKLKEILKMPQIYQNAVVTITADRAADCRNGFSGNVQMNGEAIVESSSRRIPYRTLSGKLGSIMLRKLYDPPPNSHLSQPIYRRAWTYQETYFARRVLSFGDQLRWQCESGHDCMFGVIQSKGPNPFSKKQNLFDRAFDKDSLISLLGDLGDFRPAVEYLFKAYRQRLLTQLQTSDKPGPKSIKNAVDSPDDIFNGKFLSSFFSNEEKETRAKESGKRFALNLQSWLSKKGHLRPGLAVRCISENPKDFIELIRNFGLYLWECSQLIPQDFLSGFDRFIDEIYDLLFALFPKCLDALPATEPEAVEGSKPKLRAQPHDTEWLNVIERYSRRQLSYQHDRFLALSGVAAEFAGKCGDSYMAGLWEHDLFRGMMWHHNSEAMSPASANLANSGFSSDYIAPSWSWASYPYGVAYLKNYRYVASGAKLLDHNITLVESANAFGQISGGTIKLLAPMQKVRRRRLKSGSGAKSVEIYSDVDQKFSQRLKRKVWLMELSRNWGSETGKSAGLILSKVKPDAFKRVGLYVLICDLGFLECLCNPLCYLLERRKSLWARFQIQELYLV